MIYYMIINNKVKTIGKFVFEKIKTQIGPYRRPPSDRVCVHSTRSQASFLAFFGALGGRLSAQRCPHKNVQMEDANRLVGNQDAI